MKKKLITLLIACLIVFSLIGCGTSYQESMKQDGCYTTEKGYFTTVKRWGGGIDHNYSIIYANDTRVMYLVVSSGYQFGITPLYNTDGTLQIYNGE